MADDADPTSPPWQMDKKWCDGVESAVAALREDCDDMRKSLSINTQMTAIVDKRTESIQERQEFTDAKIDELKNKVTPVVDVMDAILPGVKVMAGLGKLGIWVWQRWVYVLATIVLAKIMFSGGGFDAARDAFWLKLMEPPPK